MWWTWTRRSYAPFFLPAGALLAAFGRLTEPNQGFRFEWLWASTDAGRWLMFGGAVIAGAAAWEAWLTRRRTMAFEGGLANAGAGRLAVWAGAVTWWLALHAVVVGAHLAAAAVSGAVGAPDLLHLAAQAAAVAGWCALGTALGWWVRSPAAAPTLSALILVLAIVRLPDISFYTVMWFGMARSSLGLSFLPAVAVLKLVIFTGLTLLVIATPRWRWLGRGAVALGTAIAVGAAVPAVSPRPDLAPVPISRHTCAEPASVRVCGIPELSDHYGSWATEVEPIVVALRELGVQPPHTFRVFGPDGPAQAEPGVGWLVVRAEEARRGSLEPSDLVAAATMAQSCGDPADEHWEEVVLIRGAVYGWSLRELGIGAPPTPTIEGEEVRPYPADLVHAIRNLPAEVQRAWFTETFEKLWRCDETGYSPPEGLTDRT